MKKYFKPILISLIALAVAVGGIYAGYRISNSKKTATVCSLANYGMDGYWGDNIQSSGTVESDQAQMVYVTSGSSIKSVSVAEGQHVEAGDVLLTVEKENSNLTGKALELEQGKQALAVEETKLARLLKQQPVSDASKILSIETTDSKEYVSLRTYSAGTDPSLMGMTYTVTKADGSTETVTPAYSTGDKVGENTYDVNGTLLSTTYYDEHGNVISGTVTGTHKITDADADSYFTVTEKKSDYTWTSKITYYDGETHEVLGYDLFDSKGRQLVAFNPKSGYTASQLSEEIRTQTAAVKQQGLSVKILENELTALKNARDDGTIRATISGTVTGMQDKDNVNTGKPFLSVTATDQYYISGSIGEFYLDQVNVGDTVSITSWDNGAVAYATITGVSDMPTTDGYSSGGGNTNVSNYEFKATFDMSSGIELGSAVDISITPSGQEENGLYIDSCLIRQDEGGSYIMKMNAKNRLEKVYVQTGKNLWGSYTEISGDVTMEDYLAFPYGNGAKEGIKCEIADNLEGY